MRCLCSTWIWKPMMSSRKLIPWRGMSPTGAMAGWVNATGLSPMLRLMTSMMVHEPVECKEVSVSVTLTFTYHLDWVNITTNDDEHVYGCTQYDRDDQSPSNYTPLMEWEYALIKPRYWGSRSLLSTVTNNLTERKRTTQENACTIEKYNNATTLSNHPA